MDNERLHKFIGNRIAIAGKGAGFKKRNERAKLLGVTSRCLSNWENGARRVPIVDLHRIAHTYKKHICWFLSTDEIYN